ncbi:MAG TPA: hypothetical protein VKK79_14340 [Candidatus Lokiarchaeia archaeon]|nr:hypothetical protein [Candidatus Lokiarchaeia archaeon]
MPESDVYEKLRQKINLFFINTPKSPKILKILERVFSPEEAELLSNFNTPYIDAMTIDKFAKKAKVPVDQVEEIVDRLSQRGLIFKFINKNDGLAYYSLMPIIPGVFEFYYAANPDKDPDEERPMADWFESYLWDTLAHELPSAVPWARILPAVEPIEQLIEVNQGVDVEPKILPFEQAKEVLQACRSFAVMPCACRVHGKYVGRDVSKWPIDVCLTMNSWADYVVERGIGRAIEMEEALQILKDSDKVGLVHSTSNSFKTQFICNCDPENCGILGGFIRRRYTNTFAKSNFLPEINAEACTKCEKCVGLCPPQALFHHYPHTSDLADNFIAVRENICIGCGVCAANCKQGAIQLKKIREATVVDSVGEMWQAFKANKLGIHEVP